jgi:mannose-1-phosphate guanylyltransferase
MGVQVVVLAGGFGTRLRPWTNHCAKPLLPLVGRTLLERVVEALDDELVDEVLVAAGYGIEQMREHFATVELPYPIRIVEEFEPLGTGGAIRNCQPYINGTFVVLNGDLVSSVDIGEMLEFHRSQGGIGSISLWQVADPTRFGIAELGDDGRITRFMEKPTPEEAFSNLINAGAYILEPEIFSRMPEGAHSIERDVYPGLAAEDQLNGFPFTGWFVDAGTPESWIEAMEVCLTRGRWPHGSGIPDSSWAGEGTSIAEAASIELSAIGDRASIGEGAVVSHTSLLDDSSVGGGAQITGCLVGKRAVIGARAVLSNVVIDYDSVIPEGHIQDGGVWPIVD